MAATKLSTDVIDLSTNTEGLVIPSGVTGPDAIDTTGTCSYPTTATALYQLQSNDDDTCNNYDGTLEVAVTYPTGKFGNSALFNGGTSKIDLPNSSALSKANDWSWSFWIYASSFGSDNTILRLTSNYYTYVTVYTNRLMFYSDPTSHLTPVGSVVTGVWQNFVITKSSTAGVVVYKNGASIYTDSGTANANATSAVNRIGAWDGSAYGFPGQIAQVRLFPSVLSQADVTKLYNETNVATTGGRPTSPTEGLLRDNTTTGALEFYDGSLWQQISGTLVPDPPVPADVFSTILWNGNATARSIAVGFAPGLVWLKNTNNSTNSTWSNSLFDTSRSSGFRFVSDSTAAEQNYSTHFSGISSTGFNLPSSQVFNDSGGNGTYVSWNWKAGGTPTATNSASAGSVPTSGSVMIDDVSSTTALVATTAAKKISANTLSGFSIVKVNTNGSGKLNYDHGLNNAPELVITKYIDGVSGWYTYTTALSNGLDVALDLQTDGAVYTAYGTNKWSVTNSVVAIGSAAWYLGNNQPWITYNFHSIAGYSKIGTYTGTSAAGNFQETGFEPSWVMVKCTNATGRNWVIVDNKRISGSNYYWIYPNKQDANEGPYNDLVFNSTGFTLSTTASFSNQSGDTYIYMAFA